MPTCMYYQAAKQVHVGVGGSVGMGWQQNE